MSKIWNSIQPMQSSYSPLCLQWRNENIGRSWAMTFQIEPTAKVIVEGDEPTLEEMVRVLSAGYMPTCMAEVFLVIARVEIARRLTDDQIDGLIEQYASEPTPGQSDLRRLVRAALSQGEQA